MANSKSKVTKVLKEAAQAYDDREEAKAKPREEPAPGLMESAAVPAHWNAGGEPLPGNPLLDPGPPPVLQAPANTASEACWRLYEAARGGGETARQLVLAIQTMRQPPDVSAYKAEVLAWLDALDAYGG